MFEMFLDKKPLTEDDKTDNLNDNVNTDNKVIFKKYNYICFLE